MSKQEGLGPAAVPPGDSSFAGGFAGINGLLVAAWALVVLSLHFFDSGLAESLRIWRGFPRWATETLIMLDPFSLYRFAGACWAQLRALLILALVSLAVRGAGGPAAFLILGAAVPTGTVRMAFGIVSACMVFHGLGLAGLMFTPVFAAVIGLLVFMGLMRLPVSLPRRMLERARSLPPEAWLALSLLVFWFFLSSVPSSAEDPFIYHWGAPEHYLKFHKMMPAPYCLPWNFPLFIEMLYAPGLSFVGEDGAKLVNCLLLALTVRLVLEMGRNLGEGKAVWYAAWLFLGSFHVGNTILNGKNDLGPVFFGLLALSFLMRGAAPGEVPPGRPRRSALWCAAGVFGGAVVATKVVAGSILLGAGAAVLWTNKRIPLRRAVIAIIPALGVAMPWYFQLWYNSGNPVLPMAPWFFPDPWWGEPEAKGTLQGFMQWADPDLLRGWGALTGLWAIVRAGVGIAFLAPMALVFRPPELSPGKSRERKFLLAALVLAYVLWLFSPRRASRYLFPLLPLVSLLIIPHLRYSSRRLRQVLALVSILQVLSVVKAIRPVFSRPYVIPYLLGQVERSEFLSRTFTSAEAAKKWVNASLGGSDNIWLTGEDQRFGFGPKVTSQYYTDMKLAWKWSRESRNASDMRKKARQWGITHIMLNSIEAAYRSLTWYQGRPWTDHQLKVYGEFFRTYADLVYRSPRYDHENGSYFLWRIREEPGRAGNWIPFLPGTEGVFSPLGTAWEGKPGISGGKSAVAWARERYSRLPFVGYMRENLARYLMDAGMSDESEDILRALFEQEYECDGTAARFGQLLLSRDRSDPAIRAFARACRVLPEEDRMLLLVGAYVRRADVSVRTGEKRRAARDIDAAMTLSLAMIDAPQVRDLFNAIALVLYRMGRGADSLRFAELAWQKGHRTQTLATLIEYLKSPPAR